MKQSIPKVIARIADEPDASPAEDPGKAKINRVPRQRLIALKSLPGSLLP
jgi:hypothetical protein